VNAPTTIRTLAPADVEAYRALRLEGLRDSPESFSSDYDENARFPIETFAQRIAAERNRWVLGAFDGAALVGVAGYLREQGAKVEHKAMVWGMYVTPRVRGRGIAADLLARLIAQARAAPGLAQLVLSVTVGNAAARNLYVRAGFVRCGVEPRSMRVAGRWLDEEQMVLDLRADAVPRSAQLVDWLFVLAVRDLERSTDYLQGVLGFEDEPIDAPGWRFIRRDGCRIRLGRCPDALPAAAIGDHSYFAYLMTNDARQLFERAVAAGAEVRAPLADKPWGIREFCIALPEGHRIVVGEPLGRR
jgi:RimJ/RimL family protein N-acetyltransferase/predicted enzyme related to lactoylglutathione lyase